MAYYLAPIGNDQQVDANGAPVSGGKLFTYVAGTSTPATTYTDDTGATAQANPIVLNSLGLPASPVWLQGGRAYKFVFQDANGVQTRPTVDDISGINDLTAGVDQWVAYPNAPTYISATSFSVAGDQTPTFQQFRRIKSANTGGTIYSTIASASYAAGITTVTVLNDSGTLDSGLSSVSYSLLSVTNPSIPRSVTLAKVNGGPLAGLRNRLVNPLFSISQKALGSTADDVYAHDQWYALTQTAALSASALTDVEDGMPFMARLTQSQAAAQRIGYAQIIEGKNCKDWRGKTVTFHFDRVRLSSSANVRYAVLEWTGTEDAVTSDVVLDWTSASYTAGGFFLAANLTVSGVVQQALTAATMTDGTALTVTLGSAFNNLIVFAWTEAAAAQNVTLDLGKAQIELGSVASPCDSRPYPLEMSFCQRYLPAFTSNSTADDVGWGGTTSTSAGTIGFTYFVEPRVPPTGITVSSVAHFALTTMTASSAATAITLAATGKRMARLSVTGTATPYGAANQPAILLASSASGQILFTGSQL